MASYAEYHVMEMQTLYLSSKTNRQIFECH